MTALSPTEPNILRRTESAIPLDQLLQTTGGLAPLRQSCGGQTMFVQRSNTALHSPAHSPMSDGRGPDRPEFPNRYVRKRNKSNSAKLMLMRKCKRYVLLRQRWQILKFSRTDSVFFKLMHFGFLYFRHDYAPEYTRINVIILHNLNPRPKKS
jgi:hypothetical protein